MKTQWLFVAVCLCVTTPALSTEFICQAEHVLFGEWNRGEFSMDEFKLKNKPDYSILFRTGDNPGYAFFNDEKNDWVWEKLYKTESGGTYYGEEKKDDFISANIADEKYLIFNRVGRYAMTDYAFTLSSAIFAVCSKKKTDGIPGAD